MNIVCKEYVACRNELDGALVLSKYAGSAKQLVESWCVDPFDITDIQAGIMSAMRAPQHIKIERMSKLRENVFAANAKDWAETFLEMLRQRI